jgi:hypothetical protein
MGLPTRICEPRERIPAGDPPRNELSGGVRLFGKVQGWGSFCFHPLFGNTHTNEYINLQKEESSKTQFAYSSSIYMNFHLLLYFV